MLSIRRTFDNFEEFNSFPHGWDADFRVTTAEAYRATIEHLAYEGLLINIGSYTQATLQQGSTPEGMRSFALPRRIAGPMSWLNHEIDDHSLMLFPDSRELFSVSRAAMDMATISISDDLLERQLAELGPADHAAMKTGLVRQVGRGEWEQLHRCLNTLADYSVKYQDGPENPELARYLKDEAAYQFVHMALVDPGQGYRVPAHAAAKRTRRALRYILPRLRTPLTVTEVCGAIGVGRRNLELSFRRYVGISPKQLIKQLRLTACRDEMLTGRWGSVSEAAEAWGFWHMGQFAADYKRVFGESPRETLGSPPRHHR